MRYKAKCFTEYITNMTLRTFCNYMIKTIKQNTNKYIKIVKRQQKQ